jgi:glycerophosphoryl diester phosphodiesterase
MWNICLYRGELSGRVGFFKYYLATEKANAFTHRMGLYVVAWTVNNVDTAIKLRKSGVNGIATDDVELIKSSLI